MTWATILLAYAAVAAATLFVLDAAWTHSANGPKPNQASYAWVILWAVLWPVSWLRVIWSYVR